MPKNKTYYSILFYVLAAINLFVSCNDNDWEEQHKKGVTGAYMKIRLNLPEFNLPATDNTQTRAMDKEAETIIAADKLKLLAFKTNAGDSSAATLSYIAPISSVQTDPDNPSLSTITVKLVKSATTTENYDFVVIANYDMSNISLIEGTTTKGEVLNDLIYTMPGENGKSKWNAHDVNYTPFPMWGELADLQVNEGMLAPQIDMYRALARIDIGLAFDFNVAGHETAMGLNNFKLKEINVYRTNTKGFVGPLSSLPLPGSATYAPHIPAATNKLADNTPLEFEVTDPDGADRYIREIYVPETQLPTTPDNNNTHCVIVGGYYAGSSTVSYYRLNFAEKVTNEYKYLPIYRNHRYVFNIIEIKGPGFSTPEAALKSLPNENLNYELIHWDETIHEMHVKGKYYFGLDNRELTLEAKSTANDPDNYFNIKYQTNYPLSSSDPITLEWEKDTETPFEAVWNETTKSIKITAKDDNITNTVLTDVLHVKAGEFVIKVVVNQKYVNFKYTIRCETVKVTGTYKRGKALEGDKNYITLDIVAEDETINGFPYEIYVETTKGISFRATGIFNVSANNLEVKGIKLTGDGVLDNDATEPFTVTIKSNSSSGSYCEATITPVIAKKTIVSITTYDNSYGYNIANPNSWSHKVITHPSNFGPNDDSRVKIEGFDFISYNGGGLNNEVKKWLSGVGNNGKIADILHLAFDAHFNESEIDIIMEYMKNGGIVIALFERQANLSQFNQFMTKLFGKPIAGETVNAAGAVYPFPGNKVFKGSMTEEEWQEFVDQKYLDDTILNGPFGDIREKQWGDDASATMSVKVTDIDSYPEVTIYTKSEEISGSTSAADRGKVTSFKYESDSYNIFWVGDGGFTSQGGSNSNVNSYTLCPFYFDMNSSSPTYLSPLPKLYGRGSGNDNKYEVYNSQFFCNILAWAINRSEELTYN